MSTFTFSIRRRDLAWAVALIVLLSAIWVARSDIADAGGSPPGEGIAVVYIAVGTNFPDALGVGPGAGLNGAPIILVPTNPPLDPAIVAELVRLDPRTVFIVGGTAVVSQATEDAIAALLPNAAVSRIAGANRYSTNAAFSAATFPVEGWVAVHATAFTGDNPDIDDVNIGDYFAYSDGALFAPIDLPHGSEILELKVIGGDSDLGGAFTVTLRRRALGVTNDLASIVSSPGTPVEQSTTTISNGVVDNEGHSYYVLATNTAINRSVTSVMVRYRLGASG
jgi:ell wall binding domain 2 (CWB2)